MNVLPSIFLIALLQGASAAGSGPDAASGAAVPAATNAAGEATAVSKAKHPAGVDPAATVAPDAVVAGTEADRTNGALSIAPYDPGEVSPGTEPGKPGIPNPAIDMSGFLRISAEAATYRQSHRVSEEDFLRMSREPGTLVLDARSAEKYRLLHVKGAINLSFPDITVDSLDQTIPDKSTRILIYCNNNFSGAPKPFPSKLPSASLNLSTYVSLYTYGYRNIYELGPLVDLKASRLTFEGEQPAGP